MADDTQLRSIVVDLCRLRDGLGAQARSVPGQMPGADVAVLLESYADEVALILERCGIIPVRPAPLTRFDPRLHQAAGVVPTGDHDLDQAIESVTSDGYAEEATGRPIAPARVIVYRHTAVYQSTVAAGPGLPDMELDLQTRKAFAATLEQARRLPRDHPDYPLTVAQAASQLVLLALADRDPALIDEAIAMFADADAVPGLPDRERSRVLSMHGYALRARYALRGDARDLGAAIGQLEEAGRAARQQPGCAHEAEIGQLLADARRLRDQAGPGRSDSGYLGRRGETAW